MKDTEYMFDWRSKIMDIQSIQKKPPYGAIGILFFGAFVSFLTNTLINIALPSIKEEFDISMSTVQWLSTGYMLINGILIPTSAFFIQRISNRKLLITALCLFTIGTLLASISPSFGILLTGRMIQASGSAIMMPLLMNVMLTAFPVEKRGTAMGFFGLVMITAPAIGPTLSGYIIEHYSWRTLFDVVLPFALICLILAIFKMKNITPLKSVHLDILSLILSSIAFGSLLYGFSSAGDKGWGDPIVYGTISLGFVALVLFIIRQLFFLKEPMLEFRIYKHPMFALSSAISIVISVSMFSGMILTPMYVQIVRGISPLDSGLLMLPGALAMGIMSPITGKLFDKYGARVLALVGLTIMIVTTYLFTDLTLETSYMHLIWLYTFRMFGMSMVMMPVMTNGMNQLPMQMNPHGTAMNNTLQQVSGAIGTAFMITVMNKRTESSAAELAANAKASMGANATPPSAEAVAEMQQHIMHQAMLDGITHAFLISTFIALLALILAFFIKRVKPPVQSMPDTKAVIKAKGVATE